VTLCLKISTSIKLTSKRWHYSTARRRNQYPNPERVT
jgi:hypothetical protein